MAEVGGKLVGIFADNLAAMLAAEPAGGDDADDDEAREDAGNGAEPEAGAADEELPIDVLNLPTRAWSSLRRDGIQTLGDLVRRSPDQLLAIENIGPASIAEINRRLADRGLALAGSESAEAGTPAAAEAPPAASAPAAETAAERASSNGSAQPEREPVAWQPKDEAIDLLGVAGLPVLKRAVPAAAGLIALLLVVFGLRRRRARRG
jgi:hypothetical protein